MKYSRATSALTAAFLLCLPAVALAQDEAQTKPPPDEPPGDVPPSPNGIAGEFTPSKGFDIASTQWGSLNLSFYGLVRYLDQLPAKETFVDHLGRERPVLARNDINWHRTMIWFSGFALTQRLNYVITVWSLPTSQQTLAFGNLQYNFSKALNLGAGIGPTLTARSMQGSHPFWASSDRQMGEEFFRGGFSSGVWLKGEVLPRFNYTLSINTNLSQLGVVAANDSRNFAYSASVWWMPTTGEFGQRGGLADFEERVHAATRFGLSACHARENRAADLESSPNATQIRLSDGVLAFEQGALADGVTVEDLDYDEAAIDAGVKWKGLSLQAEYYFRRLSNFNATGPLPLASIFDHGFFVEGMAMVLPMRLGIYASGTYVHDQFRRFPWELSGGVSFFPMETRSWRINLHYIHVDKSPTGSVFGFYTAGQSGNTFSVGTDVLL